MNDLNLYWQRFHSNLNFLNEGLMIEFISWLIIQKILYAKTGAWKTKMDNYFSWHWPTPKLICTKHVISASGVEITALVEIINNFINRSEVNLYEQKISIL